MTLSDIEQRLTNAIESDNLYLGSAELVEDLERNGASANVVAPILRFIETHPEGDFGSPGPLVHFMEHSFGDLYTNELIQSLQRRPTAQTLLMLHRILNDTEEGDERKYYLGMFRKALTHHEADEQARHAAVRYLGYHGETA